MGQPIASNTSPAIVKDDDDGWEYEYDATETEDLYFTLDLTSHVPDALVQKSNPAIASHKSGGGGPVRDSPSNEENNDDDEVNDEEEDIQPVGNLQIIDLHTTNPLVKLDEHVFSCYWSTDLGTQVHIAQAGEIPNPRRAGTVLDVVGTSQTRLIGKPAILKPREDVNQPRQGKTETSAIEIRDESDNEHNPEAQNPTPAEPGTLLEIPQELITSKAAKEQATFLERLSSIKLQKGERDHVPFHGIRVYDPPDNIEEIRKRDKEAQAAKIRKAKDEQLAAKGDRPRKRRRKFVEHAARQDAGRKSRGSVAATLGFLEREQGGERARRDTGSTAADEEEEVEDEEGEEDAPGEDDDE